MPVTLHHLFLIATVLPSGLLGQAEGAIRSSLRTVDIGSGRIETIYTEDRHFEAPNWSRDGRFFIVNSGGRLYRLAARGDQHFTEIPTGFATRANNDHGISPDGRYLVLSHNAAEHITDPAQDWLASSIYILPIAGSATPVKVTTKAPSFWHGWSPDGKTLAFVGRREGEFDIYTIPVAGGEERRLTTCHGLDDGPDYTPDGAFIYYNSFCSGKMEIWRMHSDGSGAEQVTHDAYANWFPHPSPDGRWVVYIAYLEDQGEEHPFGKQVKLRLIDTRDSSVRDLTPPFFGGQGTINVPSWSPDGRRVAFVAFERRGAAEMAGAATRFLDALSPEQRGRAAFSFESGERTRWHFIPNEMFPRHGIALKELTPSQVPVAHGLLQTGLSQRGYLTATAIIELERVLRSLEHGGRFARDPDEYFLSVFGTPDARGTWGWRIEGHHLSLHFTVVAGATTVSTPSFFGANPAEIRDGPMKGRRALGLEEDAGRSLILALNPSQRAHALLSESAPGDIVTGNKFPVDPLAPAGIPASALSSSQQALLQKLIDAYTSLMADDIATERWARIRKAGLEHVTFSWAGSTEPGKPHYYRVQGPTFLIEYDNTQNDANHIHSIWRDFAGDFGRDLLREHVHDVRH